MNSYQTQTSTRTLIPTIAFLLAIASSAPYASAQVSTAITSSGLNTQVSTPSVLPTGQVNINITGGTRPGGGTNLFHSFSEFSVGGNTVANFLNNTGLPTTNILSRVNGGNPSSIFGTLQTTGFGGANLFLINPAGVIFGPGSSINVGGAVYIGTADYLKLADGTRFNTIPSQQDALLTSAPVAAFGFLKANAAPITLASISLSSNPVTSLQFIGGNITFPEEATLGNVMSSLHLKMASVASSGEVLLTGNTQPLDVAGIKKFGEISLEGNIQSTAGSVFIRGGKLTLNGMIATRNVTLQGERVTVNGLILANELISLGILGAVNLEGTKSVTLSETGTISRANNSTSTQRGSTTITAPSVDIQGRIITDGNTAPASPVTIAGEHIRISNGAVISTNTEQIFLTTPGNAGAITITADKTVSIQDATISANQSSGLTPGQAGPITIEAGKNIVIDNSSISAQSRSGKGGSITLDAGNAVRVTDSQLNSSVTGGPQTTGGEILLSGHTVTLRNSQILSTADQGQGGTITIQADAFYSRAGSIVDVSSQAGNDGTVIIQP